MRLVLLLAALLTLAACAGPERAEPTAIPAAAAASPLVATPTPATVVVVTTQERVVPAVSAQRQIVIPTAVPTRGPPTATPQPIGAAKGRTFPALFPPDLVSREDARWLPVPYRSQLDGNPYQMADCGPTSLAMVLGAFGREVPT